MKARKVLSSDELIAEATAHVRHWFVPNAALVQLAVEGLIAREYVSRSADDPNTYLYIA